MWISRLLSLVVASIALVVAPAPLADLLTSRPCVVLAFGLLWIWVDRDWFARYRSWPIRDYALLPLCVTHGIGWLIVLVSVVWMLARP